jgi:curved DNA-binding protein CbpA
MRPPFDPYKELGLEQSDATHEGIRAAFLRKAREWHPDKRAGQDTAEAEEAFKRIQLAYEYLYREVPVGGDDDFDTFRKGRDRNGGWRMNSDGKKRTTGIPEWGAKEGGVFSGVVQETVRLDELEHDEDDDVLYRECRCSGRFCLPLGSPDWAVADEDGPGERHFQCDSCSLYIRVTGISVTQE